MIHPDSHLEWVATNEIDTRTLCSSDVISGCPSDLMRWLKDTGHPKLAVFLVRPSGYPLCS